MDHFDLGAHSRTVSTSSPEAQRWFDLGLNWCFGFNKEEGVKCFRRGARPRSRMRDGALGRAYGTGPFYNLTWREHGEKEANAVAKLASEHIAKARALSHRATDLENQLVEALARRIPEAARGAAGGIRSLGRRLRGGDATGPLQLSRRS